MSCRTYSEAHSIRRSLSANYKLGGRARGFDNESGLRAYLGPSPPGYEWHHIIKQNGQFRPDLTSRDGIRTWIQNTDNMVAVPVIKHYCISGLMSEAVSGIQLRAIVKAHSPQAQQNIGIQFLRQCGAIR